MEIQNRTVCSKKILIQFQQDIAFTKKVGIILAFLFALVFIALIIFGDLSNSQKLLYSIGIVLNLLYFFLGFGLPYLTVNRSPLIDAVLEYTFFDERFQVNTVTKTKKDSANILYSELNKVLKRERMLYLFVTDSDAFLVDLSKMKKSDLFALKEVLKKSLLKENFDWK